MLEQFAIRQTTPPTVEPLSLQEAKDHLRLDGDMEDTHISALIAAARGWVEGFWGRQLAAATFKLTLDAFPTDNGAITLPSPPLIAVTSIAYVDTNGTTQTLSTSDYTVDSESEPARIVPAYGEDWPDTREQVNAVAVTYRAGYAAPFTAVAATDVCTITGRTLADTDIVRLSNSGGTLPAGLSANTDYYVRDYSSQTFKLAASSGGSAINITDAGTGTHFVGVVPGKALQAMKLLIGHWYENRESVAVEQGVTVVKVPMAVESLLWQDRIVGV
jgi:uncharacterized phiE125 gp8 family phage protein